MNRLASFDRLLSGAAAAEGGKTQALLTALKGELHLEVTH